jgi:hypothetical protein
MGAAAPDFVIVERSPLSGRTYSAALLTAASTISIVAAMSRECLKRGADPAGMQS